MDPRLSSAFAERITVWSTCRSLRRSDQNHANFPAFKLIGALGLRFWERRSTPRSTTRRGRTIDLVVNSRLFKTHYIRSPFALRVVKLQLVIFPPTNGANTLLLCTD